MGPGSTNAIVTKENYAVPKKDHQAMDLSKGARVAEYERIGNDVGGKPVLRRSGRTKKRSSSVPAGTRSMTTKVVDDQEIGKLE